MNKRQALQEVLSSPYKKGRKFLKLFGSHFQRQGLTQLLEQALEYRTYQVSPLEIQYKSLRRFKKHPVGAIPQGGWDDLSQPVVSLDSYQSLKSVVLEKRHWTETPLFHRMAAALKTNKGHPGYRTEDELLTILRYVENLHSEIVEIGYIATHSDTEISVAIGRHGDLLLNDGELLLACAQLSNVAAIPVTITARHREWVRFKGDILQYMLRNKNRVYAPLVHPDLADLPARWGGRRFELIRRNLISKNGTMLDIGCHWGYFCHQFEQLGFMCTAVEVDKENIYFLEKLKRASNRKFTTITNSIFEYMETTELKYDVVLALAIFHHFLKTKESFQQLKTLLERIKTREMFFLPHDPAETQMDGAHWNPPESEFVQFLLEHSKLTQARRIGEVGHRRALYQLT